MEDYSSEQKFRDEFKDRIKTTSLEELPALLDEMLNREHDYGTICHALAMGAAATAWAMEKHPQGGITGFQAGAIAWEFLRNWGALYPGKCGGRMVNYEDLLFPQYEGNFTEISQETFDLIRTKAGEKLSEAPDAHPDVVAHWKLVANGTVPFGLRIAKQD